MKRSYLRLDAQALQYDRFIFLKIRWSKLENFLNQSVRFDLYFSDYYDKCMLYEMLTKILS